MSIYFVLLLMMILLLYEGITCSLVHAPKKIKIISAIALILMTFRYVALLMLFIIKNQNYLYLLKPVVFTNLICIPICGVLSVFIFARNSKIKLNRILLISVILCIVYSIVIYKSPANLDLSKLSGYNIVLKLEVYYYIPLLIVNSILMVKGIDMFNKTFSNKIGALLIILSSSITLMSVLVMSINTNFMWLLLSDISWVITLDYGLAKFKKSRF